MPLSEKRILELGMTDLPKLHALGRIEANRKAAIAKRKALLKKQAELQLKRDLLSSKFKEAVQAKIKVNKMLNNLKRGKYPKVFVYWTGPDNYAKTYLKEMRKQFNEVRKLNYYIAKLSKSKKPYKLQRLEAAKNLKHYQQMVGEHYKNQAWQYASPSMKESLCEGPYAYVWKRVK